MLVCSDGGALVALVLVVNESSRLVAVCRSWVVVLQRLCFIGSVVAAPVLTLLSPNVLCWLLCWRVPMCWCVPSALSSLLG
jgi:hypothetical protein